MEAHDGVILTGENEKLEEKLRPPDNTWTDTGANQRLSGERPVISSLEPRHSRANLFNDIVKTDEVIHCRE